MKMCTFIATFIVCMFLVLTIVVAQETGMGTITGKFMTASGETMAGGTVKFFDSATGPSPITHEYWKFPDYFFRVEADGTFSAQLPEGTYYLMAVKKTSMHKPIVPPEEGDLIYPPWDGAQKPYFIKSGETTDLGVIVKAVPFKKEWAAKGKTGIEGVVLDAYGKPVKRVLIIAYVNPAKQESTFIADQRTTEDGKYILRVPEGGRYYVRVKGNTDIFVTADVKLGAFTKGIDISPQRIPGAKVNQGNLVSNASGGSCQAEDFETTVAGISGCLVMRKYGFTGPTSPHAMVVWLHGDLSQGDPANEQFSIAEKTAAEFAKDKVISVALVRPGYSDGSGNYSSGNVYNRLDTYTKDNIAEVGAAIERLSNKYKPDKVVIVGHSGGAAIAAVLLGMKPKLADGAVLAACPCDLVRWRSDTLPWTLSENPISWADKVSPATKVIALTGSEDTNTFPALAESYVEALKAHGVDANFQPVHDSNHSNVIESSAVSDAIAKLIH